MSRHFLSLKLAGNATQREVSHREEVIEEASGWLEALESYVSKYNISPSQIKAIDKTYLCTSPWHKHVKHLGPTGSSKSRKLTSDRGTGIFQLFPFFYPIILEY